MTYHLPTAPQAPRGSRPPLFSSFGNGKWDAIEGQKKEGRRPLEAGAQPHIGISRSVLFQCSMEVVLQLRKVSRFFYLRVLGRLVFSFISFAPRCISCFRIAGQTLERVDVTCVCFHLLHTGRANDALSHCYVIVALFSWFGSFSFCSTLFTLGHTSLRMLPPICWVN